MTELVCLRCGNTFAGHGILCPYCVADMKRAEEMKATNKAMMEKKYNTGNEFTFRGLLNSIMTLFSLFLFFL
jgi:uncharacterized protein CbrC (UPF0167 family)